MASMKSLCLVLLGGLLTAGVAVAQPIGAFRWQMQPYCNVVTVNVVQAGGIYHLNGTDDQCGASRVAAAFGEAFLNPDGSIGFGLTIVTTGNTVGGAPVHVDATITLATLSGTWRDSSGQAGAWTFTPGAGTGGSTRPTLTPGASRIASTTTGGFPALSDGQTIATVAIAVPAGAQQVFLSGQAAIFTNATLAAACTSLTFCNVGIELWDADTNVRLTPVNGSFFRARADNFGGSLSIAIVVPATPGTHNYRLQTEFNAVNPNQFLLNNASLTALTVPVGAASDAPVTMRQLSTPGGASNSGVGPHP